MATNTTYLITGVTRGIGLGLLKAYLARPNVTIVAGIRDPTTETISALPKAAGTELIVVKIDSTSDTDAKDAVATLQNKHNIHKLDVVIANAGLGNSWEKVLNTTPKSVRDYVDVNAIGPLLLFQATWPLLNAAKDPKFILMATGVSSFTLAPHFPIPSAGYGASKAAALYIATKIHYEHQNLTTVLLYPGWVKTELGNDIAKSVGMSEAQLTVEESVEGVMKQVDVASRATTSGKFIDQNGESVPW